jgi:acyl-ACP thioesterase
MAAMNELVPRPPAGRVFETTRRVRLGDADRHGRLRLDALARLLQDVGNDDFADAGLDPSAPFVARRTTVVAARWPRLGERVAVATWCGGTGSHWAERRSSLVGDGGGAVEVAALWVNVDAGSGRPARLPGWFLEAYGPAAGGRRLKARLTHPEPPDGADRRTWHLRATDLDVLGHVNNAATWAAVEDECARAGIVPAAAELEYRAAIEPDDDVTLASDGRRVWLLVGDEVRASAVVET